jgi:hypothetical protein
MRALAGAHIMNGLPFYRRVQVTPDRLLVELSSAGFLLYPTRFPEIGCITVMKAMSVGCEYRIHFIRSLH